MMISDTGKDRVLVETILDKSRKAMARIKDVIQTELWMAPSVRLALVDTAVRSIMLYGVSVWATDVLQGQDSLKRQIHRFEVTYNMGVR